MSVILIVDGHYLYRSGLRDVIELMVERARVVGVSTIDEVDATAAFDLILIDAGCLKPGLRLLLREMHESSPRTRFAIMSTSNARADVLGYLSAGFHGFVYKLQSEVELLAAINDLLSGRIYVPPWLADTDEIRCDFPVPVGAQANHLKLTPRQHEILTLLAQGMSNKEIAKFLSIAEGTTKIHTAALLRALGARNRTEAAFMAAKLVGSDAHSDDQLTEPLVMDGLAGMRARACRSVG